MSCIITYSPEGKATVKTPQGTDSILYQEALDITGSQKKSLEVVAMIYSKEYQDVFNDENVEPSFSKVISFMNSKRVDEMIITNDDILSVSSIMFQTGISDLSELEAKLTEVFRPNGILDINLERLQESGLYNQPDIADIVNGNFNENSLNKTIDTVSKMLQDKMVVPSFDTDNSYDVTDTTSKNSLGMSRKMSNQQVIDIVLNETKGYQSEADFSNKMQGLTITPIVSKYNSDPTFAKEIFGIVSSYTSVPNAEIINGKLDLKRKGSTISAINSTLLLNTDSTELRSEIEDLLAIDNDILEAEIEDTRNVVKKIESLAADVNIDIVGLSDNKSVQQIKELLSATHLFAKKATQERITNTDISNFSATRDKILLEEFDNSTEDTFETIDEQYKGYNIVKLYTELGNEELFNEYGLIKIGENLYHRVNVTESNDTLYDQLYKRVLNDELSLPSTYRIPKDKFDPNNKPIILEALRSFVNSKKNGLGITNNTINERISLLQVVFDHKAIPTSNRVDIGNTLSGLSTNLNYLRTQFISDLYKYTLNEKIKGSMVYNNILSKLKFNNRDITLKSQANIDILQHSLNVLGDRFKYSQELREYAAIKKNDPIKVLSIPTGVSPRIFPNIERISLANNPTLLGEYVGTIKRSNGYIITNTNDSFIKVNSIIYEKVGKNIFAPIDTTPSTNYYTIPSLTVDAETIKMLETENPVINVAEPIKLEDFRSKYNTNVLTDKQVSLLLDLNATPHQTVRNSYTTKYGDTEINFTLNGKSNNVTIELIQTNVDSRGQGLAKAALNDFVRILDNNQFSSDLTVVPRDKTTSESKLIGLYSSVGFRPGAIYDPNGGLVMMERRAKKTETTPSVVIREEVRKQEVDVDDDGNSVFEDILEKKFNIEFPNGARAFGTIKEDIAELTQINAPRDTKGNRTYEKVLFELDKIGVKSLRVRLQSSDSRATISSLLSKNILTAPRDFAGISVDQYPTLFDISAENILLAPVEFQIIGEKGAARLSNAITVMENLQVAKQMQEAGKDAKTIKLATGWEQLGKSNTFTSMTTDQKISYLVNNGELIIEEC